MGDFALLIMRNLYCDNENVHGVIEKYGRFFFMENDLI